MTPIGDGRDGGNSELLGLSQVGTSILHQEIFMA